MKILVFLFALLLAVSWAKPVNKGRSKKYNPNLFEGDIWLPKNQDRNAVPKDSQRWPGGVIPYVLTNVSNRVKKFVLESMIYLSRRTCLTFVERTNQKDYVKVFDDGDGCYSSWGRVGGEQPLALEANGCDSFSTAMHELLHAVGFEHEHNRWDRDDYIDIFWENIEEDNKDQFKKHSAKGERRLTPFNYKSIMIYDSTAFAKKRNLITMLKKDGGYIEEPQIPTRDDIKRVNMLYQCDDYL